MAGLAAARARGRDGGHPRVMTRQKLKAAIAMMADRDNAARDVASQLGVSTVVLFGAPAYRSGTDVEVLGFQASAEYRRRVRAPRQGRAVGSLRLVGMTDFLLSGDPATPHGPRGSSECSDYGVSILKKL